MATSSTTLTMAEQLVPDEVWAAIQPLLPAKPPHPKGGRPGVGGGAVLGGVLYVLRAGVPWRLLPAKEMGCGSGVTCWRRLRDWQEAGVWEALHRTLLDRLGEADRIDWSRASLDSASIPAKRGASASGRTRRIAANRARSAILWSSEAASPSRASWRGRTATTRVSSLTVCAP